MGKNKEKKGKERAGKEKKEKVNECKPASVKGEEFYSWDGKYCYHIVAGSVLEQGRWNGQGRKSLCNKRGFKKSVVIGRGGGITSNYKNGDSRACPGGRKRSASLRIVRSKGLKSSVARVSEPRTCHYAIVITVPDCKPSVEKNTKEKIPKEKKGKERKGKEVKDKERGNKERNTKEKKPKERKAKEAKDKEKKSKEGRAKEKKSKETKGKEDRAKEARHKEARLKRERQAKEKKGKEKKDKEKKAKEGVVKEKK